LAYNPDATPHEEVEPKMRNQRLAIGVLLAFACIPLQAQTKEQAITVTGKLTRAMAIGGETTGWMIEFDRETTVDGKQVHSIEVDSPKKERLEALENKRVKATGKISHRQGVETGERSILELTSIKEVKDHGQHADASAGTFHLSGGEWLLEDLGGSGVLDNVQATLTFPEEGKTAGNGSCNRFFGSAEINGQEIKFGPLASSRMACPEAVMNQEKKYLEMLQAAERFEWQDPHLLIYCKGFEKPLRFTRFASK
jgi:heat shock protein HslJ